jgi:acyl-CoA reductase-like NAD-dependent aldehyde dehydrogenase
MSWTNIPQDHRAQVLEHLAREAERLEQDADRLAAASAKLGRPSLTEGQIQGALAFREAIALLERS